MANAYVHPVGSESYRVDKDKFKANLESPLISAAISVKTAGTTNAVEVPPGAIVHEVKMWNIGTALASVDVSVGTVGAIGKFIASVTTMAGNEIKKSGLGGTVAAAPISGCYFSSGGVIQLGVASGATDNGRVKILVYYTMV